MIGLKPLKPEELKAYLTRAHAIVASRLSRKTQLALHIAPAAA